jgi:serine/threonine protein kinase/tetratricopeptide (TPR) repeat protein
VPNKAQDDDLVMSLVELALARAPEERERYLHSVCAHDSQLFEEVRKYVDWEERMNGFLLEPLFSSPSYELTLVPGELLDGRFRIVREVAQGGMGIVYEAVDEKLERRIAIKCAKPGFRKRLPPEVRHATEISHHNVCKIYEIHTASTDRGEIDFITMEFLEGETLAQRLGRGRLPEAQARTIAQQLSAGLAAAHRNQVIHGDLKSNNVILATGADGAVRAVITDFGLARRPETVLQTVGGTPDYMAPELWKGEKPTAASDIYALGVILYELASGHTPFPSSSEVSWEERLSPRPPAVSPKWDRVLAGCLQADPARRFRSAQEVGQALAPRSRRWMLAAAATVLLAAISGLVTYQRTTAPAETVRLALLPFASAPEEKSFTDNLLGQTAAELAQVKSSQRTKFNFVSWSKVLSAKTTKPEDARTVLGATHTLEGTLARENGKVNLHVQLTDANSLVDRKTWDAAYAPEELRYAPTAIAGVVTQTLRLPPLTAGATVNAVALDDYRKGLALVRRIDSGVDSALALFQRAVAADPDSPLTHAALAEAQWREFRSTSDPLWLARTAESVRQAQLRNPDLAPVHRMAGRLLYHAGHYEQAEAEYLRTIEIEPQNSDAYKLLGDAYEQNNQLDEAQAMLRRAVEIEPDYYVNHQDLGAFYFHRSNYIEAAKEFRRAVDLAPEQPTVHFALADAYINTGQFTEAERELRLANHLKETEKGLETLGQALLYQRREKDAIPYLLGAVNLAPASSLPWYFLGISYRRLSEMSKSEQANRRGLELAEKEVLQNPRDGEAHSYLAYFCARTGDRRRAESEAAQALQLSPNDTDTRWWVALTWEALNQRDRTIAVLQDAPPQMLADLNRWPDAADLHNDPRFLRLLNSHPVK